MDRVVRLGSVVKQVLQGLQDLQDQVDHQGRGVRVEAPEALDLLVHRESEVHLDP